MYREKAREITGRIEKYKGRSEIRINVAEEIEVE
jgi:DNA/RNA endonuclease YhcR with UshA esterase domain